MFVEYFFYFRKFYSHGDHHISPLIAHHKLNSWAGTFLVVTSHVFKERRHTSERTTFLFSFPPFFLLLRVVLFNFKHTSTVYTHKHYEIESLASSSFGDEMKWNNYDNSHKNAFISPSIRQTFLSFAFNGKSFFFLNFFTRLNYIESIESLWGLSEQLLEVILFASIYELVLRTTKQVERKFFLNDFFLLSFTHLCVTFHERDRDRERVGKFSLSLFLENNKIVLVSESVRDFHSLHVLLFIFFCILFGVTKRLIMERRREKSFVVMNEWLSLSILCRALCWKG